jgi:hypothetical protein
MVVLCAMKAFIECSSQSSTCSRVLTRRGRGGVVLVLMQMPCQGSGVERPGHPERPRKRPPLVRKLEAAGVAVEIGAPAWQASAVIGDAGIL